MIKVHPTYELMESCLRNGNKLRIAISGADKRYCGIYYATVEMPAYVDSQNPIMYLILNDGWKGYPLETGYFTVLGEDNYMPCYVNGLQSKVAECMGCGPYENTKNVPNTVNMFSRSVGSYKNFDNLLCNKY